MNDNSVTSPVDRLPSVTDKEMTGRAINERSLTEGRKERLADGARGSEGNPLDPIETAADKAMHPPMTR